MTATPNNVVYLVEHTTDEGGPNETTTYIGVYSSMIEAEAAVLRARAQPAFALWPLGFYIGQHTIDEDQWTEGFVGGEPWEDDC